MDRKNKKVDDTFDAITQSIGGHSDFIDNLKRKANRNKKNWKMEVLAYVNGLYESKVISASELSSYEKKIKGSSKWYDPSLWDIVVYFLCMTMIPILTVYFKTSSLQLAIIISIGVVALTSVVFSFRSSYSWVALLQGVTFSFFLCFLSLLLILWSTSLIEIYEKKVFDNRVDKFSSNKNGFLFIKKFASDYYDVDLILATENKSSFPFNIPSVHMPSIEVENRCILNMSGGYNMPVPFDENSDMHQAWLEGVMIHELAHCLDISRDHKDESIESVTTYSIYPPYTELINDFQSYYEISKLNANKNWREVVSDIMALGYFRIQYEENFYVLKEALIEYRTSNKDNYIHSTSCWIEKIDKDDLPEKYDDIFKYADELRRTLPCNWGN